MFTPRTIHFGGAPNLEGHIFEDAVDAQTAKCGDFILGHDGHENISPKPGMMTFVSNGQGGYIQETTYRFVGGGGGDFDFAVAEPVRRVRFGCLATAGFCVCCFFVVPLLLCLSWQGTTSELFNCDAEFFQWRTAWEDAKKEYCCQTQGRACEALPQALPETTPTVPPTPPPTFAAPPLPTPPLPTPPPTFTPPSLPTLHRTLGRTPPYTMPPQPPPKPPRPPPTSLSSQQTRLFAPPPSSPPAASTFDCVAGYSSWSSSWSVSQQSWCCLHWGRGCTSPAISKSSYGCGTDYNNWMTGWSVDKKTWCCEHKGKGCPPAGGGSATPPHDCGAGLSRWQQGWSTSKKSWCCRHERVGCLPTARGASSATTAPASESNAVSPFDCAAGFVEWQVGWSVGKKDWCCRHSGKGCAAASRGHA